MRVRGGTISNYAGRTDTNEQCGGAAGIVTMWPRAGWEGKGSAVSKLFVMCRQEERERWSGSRAWGGEEAIARRKALGEGKC